jgi:uncharacterized YkwD family protein
MKKYNKQLALVIVVVLIIFSLAACMPQSARKPVPDNYRNNNTMMDTPYTAQNNQRNVGSSDNANASGNQTSSLFSTLDYSYATITENINIRSGPNASTSVVANIKKGEEVKVIGKLNGWYVVNVPNTNKVGCISPKYAKLYSAEPATTKPTPTKAIPKTPTTPNKPTGTTGTTPTKAPSAPTGTSTPTGTGTLSSQGSRILQLANAERAKVGAKPLKSNTDLNKLATMKSQDIVEKNYFSHQSPTYGSPFDMMKTYGVSYMYAGENLAIDQDADQAHNAWMNSPGHKKNIMNPDFTEIGIGLYPKGNGSYAYTQMFIGK